MKFRTCAALAAVCLAMTATSARSQSPRLVVQITFDQLRGDLLERYRPALRGGLKRVLDHGWWVRHGDVDHGLTVSFPGHATLATGMFPSHHGLTANEWWMRVGDRWMEVGAATDPKTRIVGRGDVPGESPWRMESSSIGDWFKAASPAAKVLAIGSDAAIPYGGKRPDGTYWFDSAAGGFTTSTYYAAKRPAWVDALNTRIATLPRTWQLSVEPKWRSLAAHPNHCAPFQSGGDRPATVGGMLGPHVYRDSSGSYLSWVGSTPLVDEELLAHAGDIVRAEAMGQDDVPDYLNLTVGSTDSVGHEYGPVSLEQLDAVLRLDRALGIMLDDLDRTVGKGRYVVAISADHGAADPPEEHCLHRISQPEIEALLDRVDAIAVHAERRRASPTADIIAELKRTPFIAAVYTAKNLAHPARDDWKARLMRRSFRPGYIPNFPLWSNKPRPHHPARYGIFVIFKKGMIFSYARSVHGSPYAYDRLVPLVFYGAGVPHRVLKTGGRTVDVAPTLARLAGVPVPAGLDGSALLPGRH
jgi:predicted AlkP superfamily pyrophosphatase or phosphodiesterase